MKRLFILAALALPAFWGITSAVNAADDPITLTLATWGAPSHPHEKEFVNLFISQVERESGGRIKFKYFPNSSMVKQGSVVTAVPSGLVDIALTILDSWAGINSDVSIAATPLWTVSMEDARKELVAGRPLYDEFAGIFQKANVKVLCLMDIGPPVIASSFPLTRPEQLKGKVVRALSRGTAEVLQALQASPAVISVGEVYAALQRRTVDAAMNGIQGSIGLRYYEVADHELATGGAMGTIISGYVMNTKKFESLPADLQATIVKAANDTRAHTQDYLIRTYPDYLKQAESHGMKVFELSKGTPEWDLWQTALASFKEGIRKKYSAKFSDLLPK